MVLVAGGLPTQWMRRGTPVPRVLAGDLIEYTRCGSTRRCSARCPLRSGW
jgi:hypothetical protein